MRERGHQETALRAKQTNGSRWSPRKSTVTEESMRQVATLAQLCGHDIDGFAGMLEDFGMV